MEGQLRSPVGFLGGGGVTPSPTPTPGEPNLFYRVCPVNGIGTPVIVDSDGKVVAYDNSGNVILKYNVTTGVITEDNTAAVITALESFTGGIAEITKSTDGSNTVYTNGDFWITVDQNGSITGDAVDEYDSQEVIAVSGDAQVFADQACTKYPAGQTTDKLYVRLNQTYNDSKTWGELSSGLVLSWPEVPQDEYNATLWIDFNKESDENFFIAGTVFEVSSPSAFTIGNNLSVVYSS